VNPSNVEAVEDKDGCDVVVAKKLEVDVDVSLKCKGQATEGSEEWFIAANEEVGEVKRGFDAEGSTAEVRE